MKQMSLMKKKGPPEGCLAYPKNLGGGFKHFLFSHLFGEDSHFDSHLGKIPILKVV